MTKKVYFKELIEECGCGDKRCGKLRIEFSGRNMIEFGFIPYRCKKVKFGVVLRDKQLDNFRKVVEEHREYDKNYKPSTKTLLKLIKRKKRWPKSILQN